MPELSDNQFDIIIAGGGFAGSITALILNNLNFKVCLIEKGRHPRFAIGESSTPVADLLLREIASKYNLPWLRDFSRYGTWQASHPKVVCGLKRGFSFFKHYPGQNFATDANHTNELLVAASVNDRQSDTNWLRADFDAFLVDQVKEAGISYVDLAEIFSAEWNDKWKIGVKRPDEEISIQARFIIDATGSGALSGRLFGTESSAEGFLTNSFAVFSHFDNVPRWTGKLCRDGISTGDFPYDPDHSALHQVLDEGWMWMLRFNDRRTSLGFVLDLCKSDYAGLSAEQIWKDTLKRYPGLGEILSDISLSAVPGKMIRSERLQRRLDKCYGAGWAALPHTVGFVDPLFSSGIAHTLSGIEKLVNIIQANWNDNHSLYAGLKEYENAVFEELKLIDMLVAGCYKTMDCFGLFNAWSMLYFAATIAHEQNLMKKEVHGYFLCADNHDVREMVQTSYQELLETINDRMASEEGIRRFTENIKTRIEPFNTANLLDPSLKNMYRHTAAIL
ncbi:MAG: tryptophan 7-halogenase [Bacteroidetes bacterium]|nr:tryptophan 7-halogenase [Bacteroidota bacterium]